MGSCGRHRPRGVLRGPALRLLSAILRFLLEATPLVPAGTWGARRPRCNGGGGVSEGTHQHASTPHLLAAVDLAPRCRQRLDLRRSGRWNFPVLGSRARLPLPRATGRRHRAPRLESGRPLVLYQRFRTLLFQLTPQFPEPCPTSHRATPLPPLLPPPLPNRHVHNPARSLARTHAYARACARTHTNAHVINFSDLCFLSRVDAAQIFHSSPVTRALLHTQNLGCAVRGWTSS